MCVYTGVYSRALSRMRLERAVGFGSEEVVWTVARADSVVPRVERRVRISVICNW